MKAAGYFTGARYAFPDLSGPVKDVPYHPEGALQIPDNFLCPGGRIPDAWRGAFVCLSAAARPV